MLDLAGRLNASADAISDAQERLAVHFTSKLEDPSPHTAIQGRCSFDAGFAIEDV
jgi:hypothetical protein